VDGMVFVRIAPGEFLMGCSPGDLKCKGVEKPAHSVKITKAFEMGAHEVTQSEWLSVMGKGSSLLIEPNRPVGNVSWNDVVEFMKKLNSIRDGWNYRLPTEAEWEYAARAGTTGPDYPGLQIHPNAFGLFDMGRPMEWVADWLGPYPDSPQTNPPGPGFGRDKIIRGGDSLLLPGINGPAEFRVSYRFALSPDTKDLNIAFRCVREPLK